MSAKRVWRAWAAVGLLVLVPPGLSFGEDIRPIVGHRAPDFALHDIEARAVRLSDFLGKKSVFVNFWATWCPPCRQEMPTMERAYRKYKARGLEILAVSMDAGHEAAAGAVVGQFMAELRLSFPALLDHQMDVADLYRVRGIPTTFLIDRRGVIRAVEIGPRDWFSAESRRKLEELLR